MYQNLGALLLFDLKTTLIVIKMTSKNIGKSVDLCYLSDLIVQTYQVYHKIGWHLVFLKFQSLVSMFLYFLSLGEGRGLVRSNFYSWNEVHPDRLGCGTANRSVAPPKASLTVLQRPSAGHMVNSQLSSVGVRPWIPSHIQVTVQAGSKKMIWRVGPTILLSGPLSLSS